MGRQYRNEGDSPNRSLDRLFTLIDRLRDDIHAVDKRVEVGNNDVRNHRKEFNLLRDEVGTMRKDLRVLQDERQVTKGKKALGALIISAIGALGGAAASLFKQ